MFSSSTNLALIWNNGPRNKHDVDDLLVEMVSQRYMCLTLHEMLDTIIKRSLEGVDINYICHKLSQVKHNAHTNMADLLVYMTNHVECIRKISTTLYKCKIYTHNTCIYAIIYYHDNNSYCRDPPYYCLCGDVLYCAGKRHMAGYIRDYIVANLFQLRDEICDHVFHNINPERLSWTIIDMLVTMVVSAHKRSPKSAMTCGDNIEQ